VTIKVGGKENTVIIDMRKPPPDKNGFFSLGIYELAKAEPIVLTISSKGAGGNAHVDAAQLLPIP
jgi:hypothetical protein